jgi:hypothetical protein
MDWKASVVSERQGLISVDDFLLTASTSNSPMLRFDASSSCDSIIKLLKEDLGSAVLHEIPNGWRHVG